MAATRMDWATRFSRPLCMTPTAVSARPASSTTRSSAQVRWGRCRCSSTSTRRPTPILKASRARARAAPSRCPRPSPMGSRTRSASASRTWWSIICPSRLTESSTCFARRFAALSTDPTRSTTPPINTGGVNWRRNLAALWFAEFMAIFGFSFAFPFLSIFLNKDLGVATGHDLDLWTAASASASGLAMALASPVWGVLGDRFGRKPMLLRSMIGGAITVGLIFFAQNPFQLVVLRLLQGATSGTVAAATALVAAETPRSRVGWALGVVTSAVALGGAIGPVVGGFAGALVGLRWVFLGGGVLLLISVAPVVLIVRESPIVRRTGPRLSTLSMIDRQPGLVRQLAVLIGAQGLINVCNSATQQLVVLRLLEMLTSGVSAVSGLGFGLAGIASSAAAVGYTRVTRRLGYVRTAAVAAGLVAAAVALIGVAPWAALVV